MFIVISRTDTIRVAPASLGRELQELLADDIDVKYANRVIPDIGMAVSLFAIDKVADPYVLPGDGGAHIRGAPARRGCVAESRVAIDGRGALRYARDERRPTAA